MVLFQRWISNLDADYLVGPTRFHDFVQPETHKRYRPRNEGRVKENLQGCCEAVLPHSLQDKSLPELDPADCPSWHHQSDGIIGSLYINIPLVKICSSLVTEDWFVKPWLCCFISIDLFCDQIYCLARGLLVKREITLKLIRISLCEKQKVLNLCKRVEVLLSMYVDLICGLYHLRI